MPAPKITYEYLEKIIRRGDGQGHGSSYKPWIQIKRWNSSAQSTQVSGRLPPFYNRNAFLSLNEWKVAHVLCWLDLEVRTQFPAWPFGHPHPLFGLNENLDLVLPSSSGMQSICKQANIKHGVYPSTRIPFIWTLDFVLTLRSQNQLPTCAVVSVKWIDDDRFQNEIDPLDRQAEKLECERRYCLEIDIPYHITGSSMFPENLKLNLGWLVSASEVPLKKSKKYSLLQNFLDGFIDQAPLHPINVWSEWMIKDLKASSHDAEYIKQHLIWHQYIDTDLTRHLRLNQPPIPGGKEYKLNLRKVIFQ